jgi:hypothetical protein
VQPPWFIIGRTGKPSCLRGRLSSNVRHHTTRGRGVPELRLHRTRMLGAGALFIAPSLPFSAAIPFCCAQGSGHSGSYWRRRSFDWRLHQQLATSVALWRKARETRYASCQSGAADLRSTARPRSTLLPAPGQAVAALRWQPTRASSPVMPNPSFEPTRYGRQRKAGLRCWAHCLSPALRYLPPRSSQLER